MKLNEIHSWGKDDDDDYSIDSPYVSDKLNRLSKSGSGYYSEPKKTKKNTDT